MAFPTLNNNEVLKALVNVIIGQRNLADNLAGLDNSLVERARVDGSEFGDTYLYQTADILRTYEFKPIDATANGTVPDQANVLQQHIPTKIEQQAITLNVFRQVPLTLGTDNLIKRAFLDEGVWSDFMYTLSSLLDETRKTYDYTTYSAFLGTLETSIGKQVQEVDLSATAIDTAIDEVANNKLNAEAIAMTISNIFTELKDVTTDYNDYGYHRAYKPDDMIVVWNSYWANQIKTLALPEIFNSEELKGVFDFKNVLPAKFFGTISDSIEAPTGARALTELDLVNGTVHKFAGETVGDRMPVPANSTYVPDEKIICKIIHKDSLPYMSGWETTSEFWNPKSLSSNKYLTFARNTLEHIKNYPFITVKAKTA